MDDIIRRLLEGTNHRQVQLTEGEIHLICSAAREIFINEPSLLELETPVKICGDIHGQFSDLLRIFEFGGYPPASNYLFLGNYVDYGKQSIETLCLLLVYKIKYPKKICLLRGNHECASVNRIYGFYDECKRRFNVRLWKIVTDCFNCLPFAAIIDNKIFCVHGGLSPELEDLDQIRNIIRPTDIPDFGLLSDLLWADPDCTILGWGENERGVSCVFGADRVSEFLDKHDLDLICRSNQIRVVEDGYEFFAKRQLVTLFTAPYFHGEYDNAGAMLHVDESLLCSFEILKPCEAKQKKEGSSNNILSPSAPPCRTELEAPSHENVPKESKPETPPPFDAPNSSAAFNVLDSRMSFDDAVLCSFQILKPFDKKRNARVGNSSQQLELPPPPPPRIRKAQKQ